MIQYFKIDTDAIQKMSVQPVAPRQRAYYELMWVQKGNANFIIDTDKFSVASNAFFAISKDRFHQFLPDAHVEGQVIRFTEEMIDEFPKCLFSKFNNLAEIKVGGNDNEAFEMLFSLFSAEVAKKKGNMKVILLYLKAILYKLEGLKSVEKDSSLFMDQFDRFQMLIDQHLHTNHDVAFYADALNVSMKKLTQITKSVIAETPSSVISKRLIIEAKKLLAYSDESISSIAYDLGFDDNSYFSKFFKKKTKMLPKEFRKSLS
ncbi:helix-turn-helix domain-containing protein [Aureibacter tunicatorum]|uniref:AraC-like DNA-binding protein n=1 Tax=Aureibacter tunicatorum TaxID=866807 RepID=A0AAE3XNG6_9BACT|nr:AraC family transcriptional regulator [Aureibacter tunicatorum]MDR6239808.1 AraC-like DNA-binding protein [Aureibacter tunicatorum]BDD04283.1 hypothetical protein AUTU_17660 [Aureibacter tunicatorum]